MAEKNGWKYFAAFLFFCMLTVVFFHPVILNFNSRVPAFQSTDEIYGSIWDSWRIKYSLKNGLPLKVCPLLSVPFGVDIFGLQTRSFAWSILNNLLAILTNPAATYNIQIVFNFITSGFFMLLLVYYLTGSLLSGLLAGIIFSFSPYHFARAWQHLSATYIELIPLILFAIIRLKDKLDKRSSFILFTSLALFFVFEYYIAYFNMVVVATFIIYLLISSWRIRTVNQLAWQENLKYLKRLTTIFTIGAIFSIPQAYFLLKDSFKFVHEAPSAHNPFIRPFEDLFAQSAKPLSYFLASTEHPLFGKATEKLIGSPLYGISYTEHTLYLGWTTIILSLIAYRNWRKKRKNYKSEIPALLAGRRNPCLAGRPRYLFNHCRGRQAKSETNSKFQIPNSKVSVYSEKSQTVNPSTSLGAGRKPSLDYARDKLTEDFYIGFFVLLAIVAWFFSQPPWWRFGPLRIFMPSFFMYKVLPMFRAYCRFGIVVLFALAVLAGYGLKYILEKQKRPWVRYFISGFFCSLIIFEFWNNPYKHSLAIDKYPIVYEWLRDMPQELVIAEYPLDADSPSEIYKFYQTKHEKKIINATMPGTYANKIAKTITKLSRPNTAGVLRWLGVKYVIVHRQDYLDNGLMEIVEEIDKIPYNPGLRFVKNFPSQECPKEDIMCAQKTGPIDVYEVIAEPIKPEVK